MKNTHTDNCIVENEENRSGYPEGSHLRNTQICCDIKKCATKY